MALEAATFVNDLVITNPVSGDNVSQGDDHLRLLKSVLKDTFPNLSRAYYLEHARTDLASSTTPDLSTPASNYIRLTGTTQIDGFATEPSGFTRMITFSAALTLNHSATLVLPSADDIVTANGDHAFAISLGGGTWHIALYQRNNGKALIETDQFPTIAATDVGKSLTATDDSPKTVAWAFSPPAGAVVAWPGSAIPSGWLQCDGTSQLRTTYPALFAVIGTIYGAADGTHFNLPDYRGEFLRGMDPGTSRDPDSASRTDRGDGITGANVGTKQGHQYQSHTHPYDRPNTGNRDPGSGAGNIETATPGIATGASGGNETRPRNVNVIWIIRAA